MQFIKRTIQVGTTLDCTVAVDHDISITMDICFSRYCCPQHTIRTNKQIAENKSLNLIRVYKLGTHKKFGESNKCTYL